MVQQEGGGETENGRWGEKKYGEFDFRRRRNINWWQVLELKYCRDILLVLISVISDISFDLIYLYEP